MSERISAAKRIELQNVAEREIQRYAGDHARWHKYIHNVELDPTQVLKMVEMDESPFTIDYSCRRTGKTATKELHGMEFNACNPDQEWGVVAPREAQAKTNLDYHLESIRRSQILSAYISHKGGRRQMADTYYQFANRSIARAYGIMANVDGGDLTAASLEEVDDMPQDRLSSRFLLMMGSTRRLGASKESENKPQIRVTGVFKGADTLSDMISRGQYSVLPIVDAYLAIELGIIEESYMMRMREELAPDEYIRQMLCQNTSSKNLIWELYVRRAMQMGLNTGLEIAEPMPGMQYKRRGLIGFGYDHTGHGEDPQSSKSSLVVAEVIGNFVFFPFVRVWSPGTDEQVIRRDLVSYWRYFMPDTAFGDAYGIGLLTQVNDDLFHQGLTTIDRRGVGEGESTASTWPEWAFSPIRFEGMTKHVMAQTLRGIFHQRRAVLPYLDDYDPSDSNDLARQDMRSLVRQLPNIRPETTKASYSSYKMVDKKLGDDCFDAAMAAVHGLETRGVINEVTQILTQTVSREDLLAGSPQYAMLERMDS